MHCLVTGASGYIGRALVDRLLERDCEVTGLCGRSRPASADRRVRYVASDLAAGTVLPVAGVEQVFHLAGIAHQNARAQDYERVNVQGSLDLARQAIDAGVGRFVFFSSVKALGIDTPDAAGSAYARSKADAERKLRELCAASAMDLVILRPALVYSADAPGHLAWLRHWVRARLPAPPPGGTRSMIARDDIVRLCVALFEANILPPDLEIIATDGETYSTRRLHAALCAALQRRPWIPSPGIGLWKAAAQGFDRLRGQPGGSTWQRLAGDECYAPAGMDRLGFSPRLTFEACLEEER